LISLITTCVPWPMHSKHWYREDQYECRCLIVLVPLQTTCSQQKIHNLWHGTFIICNWRCKAETSIELVAVDFLIIKRAPTDVYVWCLHCAQYLLPPIKHSVCSPIEAIDTIFPQVNIVSKISFLCHSVPQT